MVILNIHVFIGQVSFIIFLCFTTFYHIRSETALNSPYWGCEFYQVMNGISSWNSQHTDELTPGHLFLQ